MALGYNADYDSLGLKGSYSTISPSFASAAASPLAYYKFYAGEGGMRVPLIVSGDLIPRQGVMTDAFSFVTDITPTILAFAGVDAPAGRYAGKPIEPMIGRDLSPVPAGAAQHVYGATDTVGYELAGNAALFQGDYTTVTNRSPLGDGEWHLFYIKPAPGQTNEPSAETHLRLPRLQSG